MRKCCRKIGWTATLALAVLTFVLSGRAAAAEPELVRIEGRSRFEVAENMAKREFVEAQEAIIVNYQAWADAVSATNLSNGKTPIYYARQNRMEKSTVEAIQAQNPSKIYVLGGTASIDESVVDGLIEAVPMAKITRIAGRDRYEVSARTAEMAGKPNTTLVTGHVYTDALIATPFSAAKDAATLVVRRQGLTDASKRYLQGNEGDLFIIGGAVSKHAEEEAESLTGKTATRITGKDRYEVSANLHRELFADSKEAVVASGLTFSDALVGAPLSQKLSAPILLVRKNRIDASVKEALSEGNFSRLYIIGGPNTIVSGLIESVFKAPEVLKPVPEKPGATEKDPNVKDQTPSTKEDKPAAPGKGNATTPIIPGKVYKNPPIIGNVSADGKTKIYHIPGKGSYDRIKFNRAEGDRYFSTEAEAQAAGFTRAQNI